MMILVTTFLHSTSPDGILWYVSCISYTCAEYGIGGFPPGTLFPLTRWKEAMVSFGMWIVDWGVHQVRSYNSYNYNTLVPPQVSYPIR